MSASLTEVVEKQNGNAHRSSNLERVAGDSASNAESARWHEAILYRAISFDVFVAREWMRRNLGLEQRAKQRHGQRRLARTSTGRRKGHAKRPAVVAESLEARRVCGIPVWSRRDHRNLGGR